MWSRAFCGRLSKRKTKILLGNSSGPCWSLIHPESFKLVWKLKFITCGPAARAALQEEHSNKQHGRTASVKRQRCASATSACTRPPSLMHLSIMSAGRRTWHVNDCRHSWRFHHSPRSFPRAQSSAGSWKNVALSQPPAVHHHPPSLSDRLGLARLRSDLSGWNSEAWRSSAAPSTLLGRSSARCRRPFAIYFTLSFHNAQSEDSPSSICTSHIFHTCPSSPAVSSSSQINAVLNFPSFVSCSSSSCSCLSSCWRFCSSCSSSSTKTR